MKYSTESDAVKFTSSFNREAVKTLVAFSSTKGGRVHVGITDTGP
jgi:predicted HTH transcriptional regulator